MPTPFRWGILGAAGINRRFIPGLKAAGHHIAIFGSRDPTKGRAAATEYGGERFGTYDEVLTATDVDAVYIPLPNSLHVPWSIRAAESGKHVLCEKPLAPSVAECEQMVAAAEKHGTHLVEAFMYRLHPQWNVVREAIGSGRIGEIKTFHAAFQFRTQDRDNIRLNPTLAGGVLQDAGCYCINVARWFLGEPSRVRGIAVDQQGSGVDTHCAAALEFPSGVLATLACSFESIRNQWLGIIGTSGRIEVPEPFLPSGDAIVRIVDDAGLQTVTIPFVNQYALECLAMESLVRDGKSSLSPGTDAAGTQAVIAAWKGTPPVS
jgi:xylose dehydrogenase (NAD/NADP)